MRAERLIRVNIVYYFNGNYTAEEGWFKKSDNQLSVGDRWYTRLVKI